MITMPNDQNWANLSYKEKNYQLFLKQKELLDGFLEHGAISQVQHDKSLQKLTETMGESVLFAKTTCIDTSEGDTCNE